MNTVNTYHTEEYIYCLLHSPKTRINLMHPHIKLQSYKALSSQSHTGERLLLWVFISIWGSHRITKRKPSDQANLLIKAAHYQSIIVIQYNVWYATGEICYAINVYSPVTPAHTADQRITVDQRTITLSQSHQQSLFNIWNQWNVSTPSTTSVKSAGR
jgi:hypothetical protein